MYAAAGIPGVKHFYDVDIAPGKIGLQSFFRRAVQRLVAFRGFSEDDARSRIANQATREDRRAVADIVIDNSGSLDDLERQVDDAWAWAERVRAAQAESDPGDDG